MSIEITTLKCNEETETLEAELKELSDRIAADPLRFQEIRKELARRHAAGDDQPTPETAEQRTDKTKQTDAALANNLVLKITMMEAEQAKLVLEAEAAKDAKREAEERLAFVARTSTVISRPDRDELVAAIGDVASAALLGSAAAWVARLHRAACKVAGIEVGSQPQKKEPVSMPIPGDGLRCDEGNDLL